ncbi:3'5'-cyclic nucleotide phosphodiesterase [Pelomyxa schiedti]|nr:3'5'-cyclic nucleotide phosphodiesterase [Pelomyxa schiedti]
MIHWVTGSAIDAASEMVIDEALESLYVMENQVDYLSLEMTFRSAHNASDLWPSQASAIARDLNQLSMIILPAHPETFNASNISKCKASLVDVTLVLVSPVESNIFVVIKEPFGPLCGYTTSSSSPELTGPLLCDDRVVPWPVLLQGALKTGSGFSEPMEFDLLGTERLLINVEKILYSNSGFPIAWVISGLQITLITNLLSTIEFEGDGFGYFVDKSGALAAVLGQTDIKEVELGLVDPANCSDPRISSTMKFITNKVNLATLYNSTRFSYSDNTGHFFLEVTYVEPFPETKWLLVLALSSEEYTRNGTRSTTISLSITAVVVTLLIFVGVFSSVSLSKRTSAISPEGKIDLDTGITKILEKLKTIRSNLDTGAQHAIDDVISNITQTSALFVPDFRNQAQLLDSDVKEWLHQEVVQLKGYSPEATPHIPDSLFNQDGDIEIGFSNESIACLPALGSFDYPIFEQSSANILQRVAMQVLEALDVLFRLNISPSSVQLFMQEVEDLYQSNFYHNKVHAADVVQCLFYLLTHGLMEKICSPTHSRADCLTVFCLIIAGVVHDVGHPGVNNAFLIASSDDLALRYNDKSVLENFHCSTAMQMIVRKYAKEWNISVGELKYLRTSIVSLILSTDMSVHFEIISKFKALTQDPKCNFIDNAEHRIQLMSVAMKTADISNVMRPHSKMLQWVSNLTQEFFSQGDKEQHLGLPLSPFTDRSAGLTKLPKLQTNFITILAEPLLLSYHLVCPVTELLDNLHTNFKFWDSTDSSFASSETFHWANSP